MTTNFQLCASHSQSYISVWVWCGMRANAICMQFPNSSKTYSKSFIFRILTLIFFLFNCWKSVSIDYSWFSWFSWLLLIPLYTIQSWSWLIEIIWQIFNSVDSKTYSGVRMPQYLFSVFCIVLWYLIRRSAFRIVELNLFSLHCV